MSAPQMWIVASAAIAITLIATTPPRSWPNRAGCCIGLLGQPVWLFETMKADQFGMFAVSLWFTGVYLFGALRPRISSTNPPNP